MSADISFTVREVPSTVPGAAARFIIERRVCLPDGPEAFTTFVSGLSRNDIQQTQKQASARRFPTFAEALGVVQTAVRGEREAANRLGLHVREAFEGRPEAGKVAAFVALRPPVVRKSR